MMRPEWPERNRAARSFRQFRRFHHVINSNKVFGTHRAENCPIGRVPAAEIEKIVIDQVRLLLRSPEIIVQTWRNARASLKGLSETDVRATLLEFEPLWNELFPTEQARIIQLLVERVDVGTDGVEIKLRIDGITSLVGEMAGNSAAHRNAA